MLYFCYHIPPGTTGFCEVGSTDQSSSPISATRVGLFVDFESPAQCRGTVSSWHYHYYRGDYGDIGKNGMAKFMVYRQNRFHINQYDMVPGSSIDVNITCDSTENGLSCNDGYLENSKLFEVQENDVLGVCIFNSHPALVGTTNESSHSPYELNQCSAAKIQSIDTSSNYFSRHPTMILNVHADISEGTSFINIVYIAF